MNHNRFLHSVLTLALIAALLSAVACSGETEVATSSAASKTASGASSAKIVASIAASEEGSSAEDASSEDASQEGSSVGGVSAGTSSANSSKSATSSKSTTSSKSATSSQNTTSSKMTSSAAVSLAPSEYYDVDAAFAASGKAITDEASSCFPASAKGYRINGGTADKPYLVDAETLRRLMTKPVTGSGCVKWAQYTRRREQCGDEKAITGVIPVSKLHDPIYTEMALPTDGNFYHCGLYETYPKRKNGAVTIWNNRKNGFNMVQPRKDHTNIINMGAFYLNYDVTPPAQDASITICVKDMKMYIHKKGDPATKWIQMSSRAVPTASQVGNKVAISWSGGNKHIYSKYTAYADHGELALKGSDLWTADDWKDNPDHQFLIHFWDSQINFSSVGISDPSTVDGVVCCYTAWVKEETMANKLLATVGADVRPGLWPEYYEDWQKVQAGTLQKNPYKDATKGRDYIGDTSWNGSSTNQVVASRGVCVTATPTVIFCHNVYPGIYDKVVDTDTVQKLIGLK